MKIRSLEIFDLDFKVIPLTEDLGAEISGVDVSAPISAEVLKCIKQTWFERGVILFRKQVLTVESQTKFAEYFGELQKVRTVADAHPHPAVMMVTNVKNESMKAILPEGEMQFHSDQCYYERPAAGTMLYAIEVPPTGGDTLFSDCRAAYSVLEPAVRTKCENERALFVYDYGNNPTSKDNVSGSAAPRYAHPVFRTHPETGRKSIYVNRLMTDHIIGKSETESRNLLEALYVVQESSRFIYRHKWQVGDVILWDNRCVLHARTDFDPNSRRMLQRVTIAGDRPY